MTISTKREETRGREICDETRLKYASTEIRFEMNVNMSLLFSESKSRKVMSAPNKSGDGGERKKKESILDLSR